VVAEAGRFRRFGVMPSSTTKAGFPSFPVLVVEDPAVLLSSKLNFGIILVTIIIMVPISKVVSSSTALAAAAVAAAAAAVAVAVVVVDSGSQLLLVLVSIHQILCHLKPSSILVLNNLIHSRLRRYHYRLHLPLCRLHFHPPFRFL
jgi:hypothetical protein